MRDEDKTEGQLIVELVELRRRIAELEALTRNERKWAEDALRRTEHEKAAILDSIPYAILVLDDGLNVTICNKSCEKFLRMPVGEIEGKELYDVIPHRDLLTQARKVLQDSGTRLVELYLDSEEGFPKIVRATVSAIDTKRRDFSFQIILEDVSERVQLEEQLMQTERLAGIGLLAASVAHELGNPLTVMSSTLQYVRDTLLDVGNRPLTKAIETIMDSISQMDELLRSLSEFPGARPPAFELADMSYILSQVLNLISKEAERRNIKIQRQLDEDLPRCQINSREVRQVFLNLCKNAIESMPDGGELRVRMSMASLDDEDRIRIEVSDTGEGISEDKLRFIFRPLYSTKPGGMGLGLSFCRRVVEEHDGEIEVKSQLHKGSTFSVTLPVRQRMTNG